MDSIDLEDLCNTVQQDLADLAGDNYPLLKREGTGFLDAVMSPQNRAGFRQEYATDGGDGKLKQVVTEWVQPGHVGEALTSMQDICNPGTTIEPLREVKQLTAFASTPVLTFTKAALRKFCQGPSEYRAMIVGGHMNLLFRKMNQIGIAKYLTGVGSFISGEAAGKDVTLLVNDGLMTQIDQNGEVTISEDMDDLAVGGRPILVGAGVLSRYAKLARLGCCNAYGQDDGMATGSFDWFRDRDTGIISGDPNTILAWAPGAVQMAHYVQNRAGFEVVHSHFAETNITDPVNGLVVDMEMRYDQCEKVWTMVFYSFFDFFQLPDTMFKDADERDGVNYSFLYNGVEAIES